MAQQQRDDEPEAGRHFSGSGETVVETRRDQRVSGLQPGGVRKHHDDEQQYREPRLGIAQSLPAALGGEGEQHHQHDQDDADIVGEQQQAEKQRQQKPGTAFAFADGAPVVQQRQRPQRRGENGGSEIRARHGEYGDAEHQQHPEHRVLGADDRRAEFEHRPVRRDDAGLRQ